MNLTGIYCIFLCEITMWWMSIISSQHWFKLDMLTARRRLKFVPKGPISQHWFGAKPLPEPMLTQFTDAYKFGTRERWLRNKSSVIMGLPGYTVLDKLVIQWGVMKTPTGITGFTTSHKDYRVPFHFNCAGTQENAYNSQTSQDFPILLFPLRW